MKTTWHTLVIITYFVVNTGHYPIIPCLLSSLFWFVKHGRYASFYANKGIRVNSFSNSYKTTAQIGFHRLKSLLLSLHLHKMKHISHALHHQNTETKGMGWWGSVQCKHNMSTLRGYTNYKVIMTIFGHVSWILCMQMKRRGVSFFDECNLH